jgi:hypothetical protein
VAGNWLKKSGKAAQRGCEYRSIESDRRSLFAVWRATETVRRFEEIRQKLEKDDVAEFQLLRQTYQVA